MRNARTGIDHGGTVFGPAGVGERDDDVHGSNLREVGGGGKRSSTGSGRSSRPPPILPLTPTLSPSAGARGKPTDCRRSSLSPAEGERVGVRGKSAYCRRSSLAPAEGERVGVRGLAVVLTGCARVAGDGVRGGVIGKPLIEQRRDVVQGSQGQHLLPLRGRPGSAARGRRLAAGFCEAIQQASAAVKRLRTGANHGRRGASRGRHCEGRGGKAKG